MRWIPVLLTLFVVVSSVDAVWAWWNASTYPYSNPIFFNATPPGFSDSANYTVFFGINHASLVTAGKSRADGRGFKIVSNESGTDVLLRVVNYTAWNLANTVIGFQFNSTGNVTASNINATYSAYYGNLSVDEVNNDTDVHIFEEYGNGYTINQDLMGVNGWYGCRAGASSNPYDLVANSSSLHSGAFVVSTEQTSGSDYTTCNSLNQPLKNGVVNFSVSPSATASRIALWFCEGTCTDTAGQNDLFAVQFGNTGNTLFYVQSGSLTSTGHSYDGSSVYNLSVRWNSSNQFRLYINNTYIGDYANRRNIVNGVNNISLFCLAVCRNVSFDSIIIRKDIEPEPLLALSGELSQSSGGSSDTSGPDFDSINLTFRNNSWVSNSSHQGWVSVRDLVNGSNTVDTVIVEWDNGTAVNYTCSSGNTICSASNLGTQNASITFLFKDNVDGKHKLRIWANDSVGNRNQTGKYVVLQDTKSLNVSFTLPQNTTLLNRTVNINYSILGESGNGSFFVLDNAALDRVCEINMTGALISCFSVSSQTSAPESITWNGSSIFVLGVDNGLGWIFEYHNNGTYNYTGFNFSIHSTAPLGLTWDGDYFWRTNSSGNIIQYYKNGSRSGANLSHGDIGVNGVDGVVYDGEYLWTISTTTDTIYRWYVNGTYTGFSFSAFAGDTNNEDIAWDGQFLLVPEDTNNILRRYYPNGTAAGSINIDNIANDPRGVVFVSRFTSWYSIDDGANSSIHVIPQVNKSVSNLSLGAHKLTVWSNDSAGNLNASIVYFSVETTPRISFVSPANTTTNDSTPLLNVSFEDETGVIRTVYQAWYSIDDGANSTVYNNTQNLTFNLASLADGAHHVEVFANTSANNIMNSSTVYFTVDTSPPTITYVAPTDSNNTFINRTYYTVNVSLNEAPSNCLLEVGGANVSMTVSGSSCLVNRTSQAEVLYDFRVWANDSVGNLNVSVNRSVTLDRTAPSVSTHSVTQITPSSAVVVSGASETVNVSIFLGTSSGGPYTRIITDSAMSSSHTTSVTDILPLTTYYYIVQATDRAGLLGNSTQGVFVTPTQGLSIIGGGGGGGGGAAERCGDRVDNDGDGVVDENCGPIEKILEILRPSSPESASSNITIDLVRDSYLNGTGFYTTYEDAVNTLIRPLNYNSFYALQIGVSWWIARLSGLRGGGFLLDNIALGLMFMLSSVVGVFGLSGLGVPRSVILHRSYRGGKALMEPEGRGLLQEAFGLHGSSRARALWKKPEGEVRFKSVRDIKVQPVVRDEGKRLLMDAFGLGRVRSRWKQPSKEAKEEIEEDLRDGLLESLGLEEDINIRRRKLKKALRRHVDGN